MSFFGVSVCSVGSLLSCDPKKSFFNGLLHTSLSYLATDITSQAHVQGRDGVTLQGNSSLRVRAMLLSSLGLFII